MTPARPPRLRALARDGGQARYYGFDKSNPYMSAPKVR